LLALSHISVFFHSLLLAGVPLKEVPLQCRGDLVGLGASIVEAWPKCRSAAPRVCNAKDAQSLQRAEEEDRGVADRVRIEILEALAELHNELVIRQR
jgi:hypothetical protein